GWVRRHPPTESPSAGGPGGAGALGGGVVEEIANVHACRDVRGCRHHRSVLSWSASYWRKAATRTPASGWLPARPTTTAPRTRRQRDGCVVVGCVVVAVCVVGPARVVAVMTTSPRCRWWRGATS